MRVQNVPIILSTLDWSTNAIGNSVEIEHVGELSFHVVITGATGLSGTISIQGSNVPQQDDTGTHWVDVSSQVLTTASGTVKNMLFMASVPFKYVRLSWVRTAGTGTLAHCYLFTKGF